MAEWILTETDADINLMARTLKTSPIVALALANRGVRSKHAAVRYLFPKREHLFSADSLKDAKRACSITNRAIGAGLPITIYGDYDVDGVCSTVILHKAISTLGGAVSYYIPRREEGYGLNTGAVRQLYEGGTRLLLTCDNGIAALEEIREAKALGMEVVIIDHHEPGYSKRNGTREDILPEADAIVDPKQRACPYPFKPLCAAALCYKFAGLLFEGLDKPYEGEEEALLFAAIATFCDIVDLNGENRTIARLGMDILNGDRDGLNPGLRALMTRRGLDGKSVGAFEMGFLIGPCVNAAGRLESAGLAAELFLTKDFNRAEELAEHLSALNDERKAMTNTAADKAVGDLIGLEPDKVLVIYDPDVHESIAGIVAGRIKEATHHPVVMLTDSGDLAKGSARSIEGYNIFEELYMCRDLFDRFGGHSMAAGLSLKRENIPALRKRLNDACLLTGNDFVPRIQADARLDLADVTASLSLQLDALEPFGKGNREPLFITYGVFAYEISLIGANRKTLRMTFKTEEGRAIRAVAFNMLDRFLEVIGTRYGDVVLERVRTGDCGGLTVKLDILYYIDINEFNGNKSIQLRISDFH